MSRCHYCSVEGTITCKEYVGGKRCGRKVCKRHSSEEKGHPTCYGHSLPADDSPMPWEKTNDAAVR